MKKTGDKTKLIFSGWLATVFSLFLYSFTQIDLNLTLSRVSVWQKIEKAFMHIGYFQRPLSTVIYSFLLFTLYILYLTLLFLAKKKRISTRQIWILIGVMVVVLFFSYPAFSHDIFNYIFDAKIVALYQQNPYQVRPLDFPDDPMTRFMHWTHRPSIYPPLWIGISLIPYILGFGKFLFQLLAFKALMAGFYLGTIWLIWKISAVIAPKRKMLNVSLYAFSPLVLIESLVSAHNDGVMIFFTLLALYLLLKKKPVFSFLSWLFSIGIKYITVIFLPALVLMLWERVRVKKVDYQKVILIAILLSYLAIFYTVYRIGLQPWYFLWVLPLVAFKAEDRFFTWLTTGLSIGCLLRYAPFLYYGNWDPPIPTIMVWLTVLPVCAALTIYLVKREAA